MVEPENLVGGICYIQEVRGQMNGFPPLPPSATAIDLVFGLSRPIQCLNSQGVPGAPL